MDPNLYKKIGLIEAKIRNLKKIDAFNDLNDIDYLSKLQNRLSSLIRSLSNKGLIPRDPYAETIRNYSRLKFLLDNFSSNRSDKILKERELTLGAIPHQFALIKRRFHNSSLIKKEDSTLTLILIQQSSKELQTLKKSFLQLIDKCKSNLSSDDWSKSGDVCPFLEELHFIDEKRFSLNKLVNTSVQDFVLNNDSFKNKGLAEFEDLEKLINKTKDDWDASNALHPKVIEFLKKGDVKELRNTLQRTYRFRDICSDEKKILKQFDVLTKKQKKLHEEINSIHGKSINDPKWANENFLKIDQYKIKLKGYKSQCNDIDGSLHVALNLEEFFRDSSNLCDEIERLKQKELLRIKKKQIARNRKIIFGVITLFVCAYFGYTFWVNYQRDEENKKITLLSELFSVEENKVRASNKADVIPAGFTGYWLKTDSTGKAVTFCELKNGFLDGVFASIFKDVNQLSQRGFYFADKKNGPWKTWHRNGKLATEGIYEFGEKKGEWKYFSKDGIEEIIEHKTQKELSEIAYLDEKLRRQEQERLVALRIEEEQRRQEQNRRALQILIFKKENFVNQTKLEMIWVKPGTFMMGSNFSEAGREEDEGQHQVTLTKGFYLSKNEVTQGQWQSVMGENPSYFKGTDRPVENVSWNDTVEYCKKLTEVEKKAGLVTEGMAYQLPTEAQWEYACRAGTNTAYSWGKSIGSSNANYAENIEETTPVGKYPANPWGFHDMHGNVYEWCTDWAAKYPSHPVTNPIGPASGTDRIFRGGSWYNKDIYLRSALRNYDSPSYSTNGIGFRVVFQSIK